MYLLLTKIQVPAKVLTRLLNISPDKEERWSLSKSTQSLPKPTQTLPKTLVTSSSPISRLHSNRCLLRNYCSYLSCWVMNCCFVFWNKLRTMLQCFDFTFLFLISYGISAYLLLQVNCFSLMGVESCWSLFLVRCVTSCSGETLAEFLWRSKYFCHTEKHEGCASLFLG